MGVVDRKVGHGVAQRVMEDVTGTVGQSADH